MAEGAVQALGPAAPQADIRWTWKVLKGRKRRDFHDFVSRKDETRSCNSMPCSLLFQQQKQLYRSKSRKLQHMSNLRVLSVKSHAKAFSRSKNKFPQFREAICFGSFVIFLCVHQMKKALFHSVSTRTFLQMTSCVIVPHDSSQEYVDIILSIFVSFPCACAFLGAVQASNLWTRTTHTHTHTHTRQTKQQCPKLWDFFCVTAVLHFLLWRENVDAVTSVLFWWITRSDFTWDKGQNSSAPL